MAGCLRGGNERGTDRAAERRRRVAVLAGTSKRALLAPHACGSLGKKGHIEVRVQALRNEAAGVTSFELRAPGGGDLPAFTAGAHLDIDMPGGSGAVIRRSGKTIKVAPGETILQAVLAAGVDAPRSCQQAHNRRFQEFKPHAAEVANRRS